MRIGHLPLRIRYGEYEPAYSVLSRLALRHQLASISDLATQIDGLPKNFASAVKLGQHVDLVADLVHVSAQELKRSTLSMKSNRIVVFDHAHEKPTTTGIAALWGRICRSCLADDLDFRPGDEIVRPYRRFWWDVRIIDNCPIHGVPLTSICPNCGVMLTREVLSPRLCLCGYDLANRSFSELTAGQLYLDAYFVGRITGRMASCNTLLDPMPLNIIAALTNQIDRFVVEASGNTAWGTASPEQRTLLRPGVLALQEWPTNCKKILDSAIEGRINKRKRAIGPYYGSLHHWLIQDRKQHPSLDAIREAVKQHASSRFSVSQAAMLFQVLPVTKSRVPLWEVAAKCRITRDAARRLLNHLGVTDASHTSSAIECTFKDFARVKCWLKDHLVTNAAADRLGVSEDVFRDIVRAGVLGVEAPTSIGGNQNLFSKRRIDAVLHEAAAGAPTLTALPDGAHTILSAAKTSLLSVRDILLGLLLGQLRCIGRLEESKGLSGFCLDPIDLKLHFEKSRTDSLTKVGMIRARDAVLQLRFVSKREFQEVVKAGYFGATGACLGRRGIVLSDQAVQAFDTQYVTFRALCRSMNLIASPPVVSAQLRRAGVTPISGKYFRIYPRQQAEEAVRRSDLLPKTGSNIP